MDKLLVIKDNNSLVFELNGKKIKGFDVDDFIHDGKKLLPYSDNFINVEVTRKGKMIDVLRTTSKKGKYPGDIGEMMFAGLISNSFIIRNWRKKNPHFLEIKELSSGICAEMFEEGDELQVTSSFGATLFQVCENAKLFVN